jgi:hypothetical protein
MSEVDIFESQRIIIKNLQCCGNCKNYQYGNLCDGRHVSHDSWCENWYQDGLTRKDREVSDEFYDL